METIYKSVIEAPNVWVAGDQPPAEDDVRLVLEALAKDLAGWEPEIPLDVIREVSRRFINDFVVAGGLVEREAGGGLFDYELQIPREIRIKNQTLKAITIEYLLKSEVTAGVFRKGEEIITKLFNALFESCRADKPRDRYLLFPRRLRPRLRAVSDNESDLRRLICDYVAGLTEGQARHLYARFFEPGHGHLGA